MMKKVLCALVSGTVALSSVSAMAEGIGIKINNEIFTAKNAQGEVVEPFIENGSTYLPVRALSEAFGKQVSFDADNYAVYVGVKPSEADKARMPVAQVGDRIFYEEDLRFYGDTENMAVIVKLEKIAKAMYTEEEIDDYAKKIAADMPEYEKDSFEDEYTLKEYVKLAAYADLVGKSIEMPEEEYENYVTVRHILVADAQIADDVLGKIKNGADFADLIEEYNTDPGQTKNSSYTFTYNEMTEEFEKAAFALKEGEYTTQAVMTPFGFHIIERLPLDRENVNEDAYRINELQKMLDKTDAGKITKMQTNGVYGTIEGVTFTTEDLVLFGGERDYAATFEQMRYIAAIDKCFESENVLKDYEKASMEGMADEYKETYMDGADAEKDDYLAKLMASYVMYMTKLYNGELDESFDEKVEATKIDAEVFKQLRVFADGKIIVPCDVNGEYVAPKNVDGTVYVPVRAIAQALGMKADWDNDTRTVLITK